MRSGRKSWLRIAAIILLPPLFAAAVIISAVFKANATINQALTTYLPELAVKIPGISFYRHESARYNLLTDALTVSGVELKLAGHRASVSLKFLKVKGLGNFLPGRADFTKESLSALKYVKIKDLNLESELIGHLSLSCRKLEARLSGPPQDGWKQGPYGLKLNFKQLTAEGFASRFNWNSRGRLALGFDHLKALEKHGARLGGIKIAGLDLSAGKRGLKAAHLMARNLDLMPWLASRPEAGPWPWPLGLDRLKLRKATLSGFGQTPFTVKRLTFKGVLEPWLWPEKAYLQVDEALALSWLPWFGLANPALNFKALLIAERKDERETARLTVTDGRLKKYLNWTAAIELTRLASGSSGANAPRETGLVRARLDLKAHGPGEWLSQDSWNSPEAPLGKGASLSAAILGGSLRKLDNYQELKRIWHVFAHRGSKAHLIITATPERPWPLRLKARRLWKIADMVNDLGLEVGLADSGTRWPVRFSD